MCVFTCLTFESCFYFYFCRDILTEQRNNKFWRKDVRNRCFSKVIKRFRIVWRTIFHLHKETLLFNSNCTLELQSTSAFNDNFHIFYSRFLFFMKLLFIISMSCIVNVYYDFSYSILHTTKCIKCQKDLVRRTTIFVVFLYNLIYFNFLAQIVNLFPSNGFCPTSRRTTEFRKYDYSCTNNTQI